MVRAREAAFAVSTLEGFDARVLAVVACELVRACKLPCAAVPRALVWLLTSVGPPVGLQVGAFGVNFIAALKLTAMDASPLGIRGFGPPRPSQTVNAERQHGVLHCTGNGQGGGASLVHTVQRDVGQVIILTVTQR